MLAVSYAGLGDHHLAEDAVQEGFARALVKLEQLRHRKTFGFWLGRICRNVARTMANNQAREVITDDLSQVSAKISQDQTSGAIREAIDQFPRTARELIVLRYYNNLSYEQMSVVTGYSQAAINNRLGRAKRKMAAILNRNGFLERKR